MSMYSRGSGCVERRSEYCVCCCTVYVRQYLYIHMYVRRYTEPDLGEDYGIHTCSDQLRIYKCVP